MLPNQMKTTFFSDFSIADAFGEDAVKDTYKRAFNDWKNNLEYVTELVCVLNWKSWQHYEKNNDKFCELYVELFEACRDWCYDNLKGDELRYFLNEID